MNKETLAKLEKIGAKAWSAADAMRGHMDSSEYRGPLLGIQCYAYLSKEFEKNAEDYFEDCSFERAWEEADEEERNNIKKDFIENRCGYFIKPQYLFKVFLDEAKRGVFVANNLKVALDDFDSDISALGDKNSKQIFLNLFEMTNMGSSVMGNNPAEKNLMYGELIKTVALIQEDIDILQEEDSTVDVMAYIYEYMLSRFASSAGKKGGEFLTPHCASKLLSKLVLSDFDDVSKIKKIGDPTMGTLSLVNTFINELKDIDEDVAKNVHIYGQEKNFTTAKLAGINMLYNKISSDRLHLFIGDTLLNDGWIGPCGELEKLNVMIANPPYSTKHLLDEKVALESDERFKPFSRIAPQSKADYSFVQHMIAHTADNARFGLILPHGVLFRGSSEGIIRKEILNIKHNGHRILNGIIGLPAGMFYGTGIPVCILLFNKEKTDDTVMFVDASKEFVKDKQNYLDDSMIDKIVKTYHNRKDVDKYAHLASFEEIERNDYNLNIPRYVDTTEEEEKVDINEVIKELDRLEIEMSSTKKDLMSSLKKLGIIE